MASAAPQPSREDMNRAFWELGLRFQWDEATWLRLAPIPETSARLAAYLEGSQPHLLAVYDPRTLGALVEEFLAHPDTKRLGMEAFTSTT